MGSSPTSGTAQNPCKSTKTPASKEKPPTSTPGRCVREQRSTYEHTRQKPNVKVGDATLAHAAETLEPGIPRVGVQGCPTFLPRLLPSTQGHLPAVAAVAVAVRVVLAIIPLTHLFKKIMPDIVRLWLSNFASSLTNVRCGDAREPQRVLYLGR